MKPSARLRILPSLFLLLFFLSSEALLAQSHTLSGKITDERNHQPLAFVNVVVNEGLRGVISDIDGKYEISSDEPILKVKFSSIGYEPKEILLQTNQKKCNVAILLQTNQKKCNVALKPMTFELGEVTVEAGENPAHRIIDSLMAHRKANNPNSLDSYRYNIYDKMVFTVDSSSFGQAIANDTAHENTNLQLFDSIMKKSDLMVMETASEVLFKSPDRKLQHVLGTKVRKPPRNPRRLRRLRRKTPRRSVPQNNPPADSRVNLLAEQRFGQEGFFTPFRPSTCRFVRRPCRSSRRRGISSCRSPRSA